MRRRRRLALEPRGHGELGHRLLEDVGVELDTPQRAHDDSTCTRMVRAVPRVVNSTWGWDGGWGDCLTTSFTESPCVSSTSCVGLMSHLGSPCVFLWLALQWLLFGSSPIQACDSAVLTAAVVAYGLADFMTWRRSLFPKPASALLFFVACPALLIPAMARLPGAAAAMALPSNALHGRENVAVVASVAVAASSVVVWFLPARHARRRALSSYGTLRARERGTGHLHHTD